MFLFVSIGLQRKLIFGLAVFLTLGFAGAAQGAVGLKALADTDLEQIDAAGGVGLAPVDVAMFWSANSLTYTDTDTGQSLVLKNVSVHDGLGGPFTFSSGNSPVTFDVFTVADLTSPINGKSVIGIEAPDWHQQVYFSVGNLIFAGQELGRLDLGGINQNSFHWYLAGHNSGVDAEFGTQSNIDAFRYSYNTAGDAFEVGGLHLAETATGDPTQPSTWSFAGQFRIGDMLAGNPATVDIVTSAVPATPGQARVSLRLNLPASGTVRIENLGLGNANFGPCALDGLRVHRLQLDIFPGG